MPFAPWQGLSTISSHPEATKCSSLLQTVELDFEVPFLAAVPNFFLLELKLPFLNVLQHRPQLLRSADLTLPLRNLLRCQVSQRRSDPRSSEEKLCLCWWEKVLQTSRAGFLWACSNPAGQFLESTSVKNTPCSWAPGFHRWVPMVTRHCLSFHRQLQHALSSIP